MNAIECGQICKSAEQAIRYGVGTLSDVPALIKRIIEEQAWKCREVRPGQTVELSSLHELITKPKLDGWGEDPKKVEGLLKDEPEVLTLWRNAMKQRPGPRDSSSNDNIMETPQGTSRSYTLDRLERDHPELHQRVIAGELSANAAAITAGFRKPTITVAIDPDSAARSILKHFSDEQALALASKLVQAVRRDGDLSFADVMLEAAAIHLSSNGEGIDG